MQTSVNFSNDNLSSISSCTPSKKKCSKNDFCVLAVIKRFLDEKYRCGRLPNLSCAMQLECLIISSGEITNSFICCLHSREIVKQVAFCFYVSLHSVLLNGTSWNLGAESLAGGQTPNVQQKLFHLIEPCAAFWGEKWPHGNKWKKCSMNKQKAKLNNFRCCFEFGLWIQRSFKQANYMNYELHDCYAHKFINYEIFGASFAILLCSTNLSQGLFFRHTNNEWINRQKEYRKNI